MADLSAPEAAPGPVAPSVARDDAVAREIATNKKCLYETLARFVKRARTLGRETPGLNIVLLVNHPYYQRKVLDCGFAGPLFDGAEGEARANFIYDYVLGLIRALRLAEVQRQESQAQAAAAKSGTSARSSSS